ncbi:MAG: hypothetical protein JXQ79_12630 [Rhodobacteraceae bacterium]|nr:hypothetical protein [Paracoccaceae bacterium]
MRLRSALLALMMVLMLPLGALNAWVPVVPDTAPHSIQTGTQSNVQSPRTCRSGFLPGASCAKFLDHATEPKATAPRGSDWLTQQARIWPVQDHPTPPQGPPRTV